MINCNVFLLLSYSFLLLLKTEIYLNSVDCKIFCKTFFSRTFFKIVRLPLIGCKLWIKWTVENSIPTYQVEFDFDSKTIKFSIKLHNRIIVNYYNTALLFCFMWVFFLNQNKLTSFYLLKFYLFWLRRDLRNYCLMQILNSKTVIVLKNSI